VPRLKQGDSTKSIREDRRCSVGDNGGGMEGRDGRSRGSSTSTILDREVGGVGRQME